MVASEVKRECKPQIAKLGRAEITRRVLQMYRTDGADKERGVLAERLGVQVAALERLQVGIGWDHDAKQFSSWPERDILWRPIGISRRYADGTKKHLPGSTRGLSFVEDWWTGAGPVLLVEGGSDVAALVSMGLCAIGRPSNVGGVSKLAGLLSGIGNRPVIVFGENDRKPERIGTGLEATRTVATLMEPSTRLCPRNCPGCCWCFPGKGGAERTVANLTLAMKKQVYCRMVAGAKDVREWLKLNGADLEKFGRDHKFTVKWLRSICDLDRKLAANKP